MISKTITVALILVAVLALGTYVATASGISNPSWAKVLAGFWSDGQISDSEFLEAVQFLTDENIIHVEPRIIEAQAKPMPTDNGKVWEAIGALQEEDDQLHWEIDNTINGVDQYDELGDFIGAHELRIIELEADVHDLKLQLGCLIDAVNEGKQANCSKGGMTT